MIAFWDNLPLIQHGNGHVAAFQRDWLIRSLAKAAAKAGYAHWWLAEHVAQSVTEHLRQQRECNVVPIDRLCQAVKTALEGIGYSDVALVFEPSRPKVEISLIELAHEAAGSGYELAFFEKLRHLLHQLVCERSCDFELRGLNRCVKLLKSRKVWSRDCEALRTEIIEFTRSQATALAGQSELSFAVA
jgi:hypothetical protein